MMLNTLILLVTGANGAGLIWRTMPRSIDFTDSDHILSKIRTLGAVDTIPFKDVYLFGDSACDTGNYARKHNFKLPSPKVYWRGRFSNGPMWPDYFQAEYNLNVKNYCHGGSLISTGNYVIEEGIPDYKGQVQMYKEDHLESTRPLAILQFSGNDMLNKSVTAETMGSEFQRQTQALVNLGQIKDFIVVMSPGEAYNARGYSRELMKVTRQLRKDNPDARFVTRSLLDLCLEMFAVAPPITNSELWRGTEACFNETSKVLCPDPENHFFFDFYHITTIPAYNFARKVANTVQGAWGNGTTPDS
ncbi:hypothetical protein DSO57_1021491 [Entomophthora muscae]|uniref:Uncharacterized protein n=2 Tax=Entomophthora muscae TaxID=34485 RepID=A0ACC2UNI9_9FUNG|nr:hypothetical protein DSO57_1027135 [Entomophthora muscae]KAJ9088598.1 hypothetical protein DSO57_1021491 [Entomophthora muscae]